MLTTLDINLRKCLSQQRGANLAYSVSFHPECSKMLQMRWVCGVSVACAMASAATAGVVLSTPLDFSSVGAYSQTFQVSDYPGAGFASLTGAVFSDLEQGEGGNLGIRSNIANGSGSGFGDSLFFGQESVGLANASSFTVFFIASAGSTFTLESFNLTVGSQSFTVTPGSPTSGTVPEPSSLLLAILGCGAAGALTRIRRPLRQV